MTEPNTWKPIHNYPDYEISNSGTIRSWKRRGKTTLKLTTPLVRTPTYVNDIPYIRLTGPNTKQTNFPIARLVLQHFGPPTSDPVHDPIIYLDNDKTNIHISNLKWSPQTSSALIDAINLQSLHAFIHDYPHIDHRFTHEACHYFQTQETHLIEALRRLALVFPIRDSYYLDTSQFEINDDPSNLPTSLTATDRFVQLAILYDTDKYTKDQRNTAKHLLESDTGPYKDDWSNPNEKEQNQ